MKTHSLKSLDKIMGSRRFAAAKAKASIEMEAMLWGEVRKQLGFTQTSVPKALGGELDIVARFGDRSIVLARGQ